ncbi:hypothetical protein BG004_005178 [Podila humilis]|nr:hypothetical protein BG004_005178 [Podila humilis]
MLTRLPSSYPIAIKHLASSLNHNDTAMNPSHSSYVEYGTGNMLNLDAGTIKRKTDSNEYDDEIFQEVQPNGKRACGASKNQSAQFASFGVQAASPETHTNPHEAIDHGGASGFKHCQTSHTGWPSSQSDPSPLLRTAVNHAAGGSRQFNNFHTPESINSSLAVSPSTHQSMDTDMDMASTPSHESPTMNQNTAVMLHTSLSSPLTGTGYRHHPHQTSKNDINGLLPSALPEHNEQQQQQLQIQQLENGAASTERTEYMPVHGRSMEIPSYARVPMNEMLKYRDQRWSSCIYGADARIGQGMMI